MACQWFIRSLFEGCRYLHPGSPSSWATYKIRMAYIGKWGHFPAVVPGKGWCWGSVPHVMDAKSHVHLGKLALLQLITRLRSCMVQSYFPSLQVNKAFKSTETQLLFLPHVPRLSLINPIPGKWKAVLFSAFGAFQLHSFHYFFPKDCEGHKPGLLLCLPQRGRDPSREGH